VYRPNKEVDMRFGGGNRGKNPSMFTFEVLFQAVLKAGVAFFVYKTIITELQ